MRSVEFQVGKQSVRKEFSWVKREVSLHLTNLVKEGGYDHKVNETVTVVTAKTTEIGQRTWGLMNGVMALASQKVEELNKQGSGWKNDPLQQQRETEDKGPYEEFRTPTSSNNVRA